MNIIIGLIGASIFTVSLNLMTFGSIAKGREKGKDRLDKSYNWVKVLAGLAAIIAVSFGYAKHYQAFEIFAAQSDTRETAQVPSESEENKHASALKVVDGHTIPGIIDDRDMSLLGDVAVNSRNWKESGYTGKADLVNAVISIERGYLNVQTFPKVEITEMNERLNGYYDHGTKTLSISRRHFENDPIDDVIVTVCHEMYHVFQSELCEAYVAGYVDDDVVASYADEFANYVSGLDNFDVYYSQKCEEDARRYSKEAARLYMLEI